ncbi:MAG: hypothetical protein LRY36_01810 [Alphaproteobacteria bacterium]|nr:hypothetical protein [Alphaproteobacteria bacterium]
MDGIYWRFWWAFIWRSWALMFVILVPVYIAMAIHTKDVPGSIQSIYPLMCILGPFIQVWVIKRLFTRGAQGLKAKLEYQNNSHSEAAVNPWDKS